MRSSIAFKIGLSIVGLILIVLAALYVSLEQLVIHTVQVGALGRATSDKLEQLLILAAVGAVFMAAGLSIFLSYRLAQPLLAMKSVTREIGRGQFHVRVPVLGNDEVSQLGQAINDLAQHLDRLDTTRKQFLADVAHELRTPLTYIKGYSEVVFRGMAESPKEEEQYLKMIYDESQRVERLIQDLFALAQADEGKMPIYLELIQLGDFVRKAVDRIQAIASSNNIFVEVQIASVLVVEVDPVRLEQALMNLLDNALRYTAAGGRIEVTVAHDGANILIRVGDTGIGIPRDELPHVWERLYRVEKSRTRERGGSGLGLAIVKQIVEAHGGSVAVHSEEGKGTVFSIRIPVRTRNDSGGKRV